MTADSFEVEAECQCPVNCGCGNAADLLSCGVPICGCCMADCPDVHGPDGKSWRAGYWVRPVSWSGGWELHIDGGGVTQCTDLAEAEETVRSYLEISGREDARTATVKILKPRIWGLGSNRTGLDG